MSKTETARELIERYEDSEHKHHRLLAANALCRRVERVLSYCEEDQSPVRERISLCRQIVRMLDGAK